MKEEFMYCEECGEVTKWALYGGDGAVEGECEGCGLGETFEDWNEVMSKVVEQ